MMAPWWPRRRSTRIRHWPSGSNPPSLRSLLPRSSSHPLKRLMKKMRSHKRKAPEDNQDSVQGRSELGAATGTSGQGNPYRELNRAAANFMLVWLNPRQLVCRHPIDLDLNVTLLQCVDQLFVRHNHSYSKCTIVVDNTLHFRSIIF